MSTPVEVPKLGNTVEECLISRWLKHKGDSVSEGEIIAEIETDKTTFELTAPVSGTLLEMDYEEGAYAPVFTRLCVIGEAGEAVAAAETGPAEPAPVPAAAPEPAPQAAEAAAPASALASPLSPRARRFANEHDFHPAAVDGSGPGGRVLEQDLQKLYASAQPAEPVSRIREKIARRMRESLAGTAQYTLHSSADASALLLLRARFKASPDTSEININDLVLFGVVKALLRMPALNAEFIDGRIHRHQEVHLGFACDTDRGLLVPVIRNSHTLTLAELARQAKELAAQAVAGTIPADDLTGATFTVSNLGSLGIESFTPILNPPQVAILGVDAIQPKLVRRDGRVEIVDAIGLSLTCDHQVIDGAPGARFLKVLKEQLERVESL
jgi:pyruvate dehydrogenase E2 component (dihydrolipoamide acetyltransferase)